MSRRSKIPRGLESGAFTESVRRAQFERYPSLRPETILVVDDEPLVRDVLRRRLELAGYAVIEAADGVSALARCRERPVSLVVTDLLMPGIDGAEFVARLRREFPNVRVIAVTGGAPPAVLPMLGTGSPFDGSQLLHKPFTTPQLLGAVEATLQA